ncbi:MAG: hypothetical protein HKN63_11680 [Rhodobacteraceae bacterium]|nr:hypothetical protein [Paracoccaceae bacterium]
MNGEILQLIDVALSVSIAAATIWIAYVANKISKLQLKMDVESQKLAWCRSCLHAMSQAVSLSELSAEEISNEVPLVS